MHAAIFSWVMALSMVSATMPHAHAHAQRATNDPLLARFVAHSPMRDADKDDARSFEGQLYQWARQGESRPELDARVARQYGLAHDVASTLVNLVLQRGGMHGNQDVDEAQRDRLRHAFLKLSRSHPGSDLVMLEAARSFVRGMDLSGVDCGPPAAFRALLERRPHPNRDRKMLYDEFPCPFLLYDRTGAEPDALEPYITLIREGREGDELSNPLLYMAALEVADARVSASRPDSPLAAEVRARIIQEALFQGRLNRVLALAPSPRSASGAAVRTRLDAPTRLAIAAVYLMSGDHARYLQWRDLAMEARASARAAKQQAGHGHEDQGDADTGSTRSTSWYALGLLDRGLSRTSRDDFDFLIRRFQHDNPWFVPPTSYWDGVWHWIYDRLAMDEGYPSLVLPADVYTADPGQWRDLARQARVTCSGCSRALRKALDRLARPRLEGLPGLQRPDGHVVDAPRPAEVPVHPDWPVRAMPMGKRRATFPDMGATYPRKGAASPVHDDSLTYTPGRYGTLPGWARQLHRGHMVRYERDGDLIVAITISHALDPSEPYSAGGYWVSVSKDGGRHFQPPLYTGIRIYEPYVIMPDSRLALVSGNHLHIEVAQRPMDNHDVGLPGWPGFTRAFRDNLYLDIPLSDLERDSDRDGLTDIAERAMWLDPHRRDTDGDGIPDAIDPLPNVAYSASQSERSSALAQVLHKWMGLKFQHAAGPVRSSCRLKAPDDRLTEAAFVVGHRPYFAGTCPVTRLIVLDRAQAHVMYWQRGADTIGMPIVFEINHRGDEGIAVFGGPGGSATYLMKKVRGVWTFKTISELMS